MKFPIPQSSSGRLRVFVSLLLSFAILILPFAQLTAATRGRVATRGTSPTVREGSVAKAGYSKTNPPVPEPAPQPLTPVAPVTASMTGNFPDPNGDGLADKGETITYTATITNTSGGQITGVEFQDTPDANTTLVNGSIQVSPIAFDDSYTATGNVRFPFRWAPACWPMITSD